jgi:hypothetical protein
MAIRIVQGCFYKVELIRLMFKYEVLLLRASGSQVHVRVP